MDGVTLVAAAVVFLGIGVGIGLLLRRQAVAATEAVLRQETAAAVAAARAEEAATGASSVAAARAAEQARAVELARARADADAAERRGADSARELEALRQKLDELQGGARRLAEERARLAAELDAERRAAAERQAEAERAKEQVRAEIEVLTGRLLDEKGKAILERNQEGLKALLGPVAERIKAFEERIEKTYHQENRDRASLLTSLETLQKTQAKLHEDAEALARALTGESKAQGDWGELVLERVLETAGLTEGREYDLQVSHVDAEGGRKRPDALVYLPGDRAIVVDAKCSLTAFVESMRATDPAERDAALDRHLASLRAHVKGLAGKSYTDVLQQRTLDIVLLFVPNEAAFHAAISRAPGLYEEAFRQGVVVCSPTTLLAALQLVGHVWRSEKQNANAQRIADEAGRLLDKLSDFVGDLDALGTRLEQAQQAFGAARSKLRDGRGNVMKKAEDLVKLGARVKPEKARQLLGGREEDGEEEGTTPLLPGVGAA
jgi:DNA recombination protein RmuC